MKDKTQEIILDTLIEGKEDGLTIREIEQKVGVERHTLAKYLFNMESKGMLKYRDVGKARLWFINRRPLNSIFSIPPEKLNFTGQVLSNIIKTIPIGILVIDTAYKIIFMNERLVKTYGDVSGETFYESFFGLKNPVKLKPFSTLIDYNIGFSDLKIVDKFKNTLNINQIKLLNPDKSTSILLLVEDISKREIDEITLALNETCEVTITDKSGVIIYANDSCRNLSKYSRDELIGKTHNIVNSGRHTEKFFNEMWETISSGRVWRGIIINKAKDGKLYRLFSTIVPLLDYEKKPYKYIAIRKDIVKEDTQAGRKKAASKITL